MNNHQPRDYPTGSVTGLNTPDDADGVTLGSVKERLAAQKPVSNEMINEAVNNLFTADSHKSYHSSSPHHVQVQSPLRKWLRKPKK